MQHDIKTVASTTIPETISDRRIVGSITIKALRSNTDWVAIGMATVNVTTENGIMLARGQYITLENVDITQLWLSVSVAGEGVAWWAN